MRASTIYHADPVSIRRSKNATENDLALRHESNLKTLEERHSLVTIS